MSSPATLRTTLLHTAQIDPADLAGVRRLCQQAFGDDGFEAEDWTHALGGTHALVHLGGDLVAHAALVLRRILYAGPPEPRVLRCGYVEAVAVHPAHRRRGMGTRVMAALESLAPGFDLLALSATAAGERLYRARGWTPWRGPLSALTPDGGRPTPDDDILTLGGHGLDRDAGLTCDWREGDLW